MESRSVMVILTHIIHNTCPWGNGGNVAVFKPSGTDFGQSLTVSLLYYHHHHSILLIVRRIQCGRTISPKTNVFRATEAAFLLICEISTSR